MPDPDNKGTEPGSDAQGGDKSTDTGKDAADAQTAEALAKFGLKPAADGGDPDKSQNDAKPTSGDPDKGTTPDAGSGDDGKSDGKPQDSEKIFGKFTSMEAAQAGYTSLVSHKTTLEDENRTLREEVAGLKKQHKDPKATDAGTGTTPRDRYLANPMFKRAYDADVAALGQEGADARLERDIELLTQQESGRSEDSAALQELRQERMENRLVEQYPELKEGKARESFDELLTKFQDSPSDDLVLDALAKAALFDHVPELIDEAVKRAVKKDRTQRHDKDVASTLTADTAAPGSPEDAQSLDEKKNYALTKFGLGHLAK